jgi:hypothetical protein
MLSLKTSPHLKRNIFIVLILLTLFGTMIFTYIIKSEPKEAEIYSCEEGKGYTIDKFLVYNNVWNKQDAGDFQAYKQCIRVHYSRWSSNVSVGWDWVWPKGSGEVKAYPEIIYGWAPWLSSSTNTNLPIQLSKMVGFVAAYDVIVTAPGASYNTAFDLWITSTVPPTPVNRTAEIMIWVDSQNMRIDYSTKSSYRRVSIDNQEYDYWVNINPNGITFIGFNKVDSNQKGSISIDHFLAFLINEGHISNDNYLADIEFGNEIAFGLGQTIIQSYSVRPNDF